MRLIIILITDSINLIKKKHNIEYLIYIVKVT